MQNFYLAAAVVGAIVPYVFFFDFFVTSGVDLGAFVSALFVNGAAGGFASDLLITSAMFWLFMLSRPDGPRAWPLIVVNLLIGLSCALPLYLYLSGRAPARQGAPQTG